MITPEVVLEILKIYVGSVSHPIDWEDLISLYFGIYQRMILEKNKFGECPLAHLPCPLIRKKEEDAVEN